MVLGSRSDHRYARWLERHITLGCKVTRIRAECIMVFGLEVTVPHLEVGTSWPQGLTSKVILLELWPYCSEVECG